MIAWRPLIIGAAGGALGLLALPLTGLLDPTAGVGQWAPVEWYMQVSARQSIALRSATIAVPPLDDAAMVQRGAGHYQLVCASCHASPAAPADRFAQDMTPPPRLNGWRPAARLFWTVKHGIRHSAMPAWPSRVRDDEVWEMVAFLRRLPTLDAKAYAELAYGTAPPVSCASCHGAEGQGRNGAFPRLNIQSPDYLADALRAFRDGRRQSGTMMAVARNLSDAQIEALAAQFGRSAAMRPPDGLGLGQRIARSGLPDRDIPACDACHGTAARRDFPRLQGQAAGYLKKQLELFQALGAGRGGRFSEIMAAAIKGGLEGGSHRLKAEELDAVVQWYSQ